MSMNVTVVGNLTRDPELRFTNKGDAVANLSIAVNERVKDGDTWVDGEPSFYEIKAWRKLAENAAEALRKGDRVVVLGKMKVEKFEGKDGEQRSKPVVTADEIAASIRFKTLAPSTSQAAPALEEFPPF